MLLHLRNTALLQIGTFLVLDLATCCYRWHHVAADRDGELSFNSS